MRPRGDMLLYYSVLAILAGGIAAVLNLTGIDAADAHFFGGASKDIGKYQVTFLPSPSLPLAGNSSFLNFSILQNGSNIYNVQAALTVTEKGSGTLVGQVPYRPYEFSDITIPYVFPRPADYTVTLHARIAGDEEYQNTPLSASFDISAGNANQLVSTGGPVPFEELMLYYVTPATVVIAGLVVYLHSKKKI